MMTQNSWSIIPDINYIMYAIAGRSLTYLKTHICFCVLKIQMHTSHRIFPQTSA